MSLLDIFFYLCYDVMLIDLYKQGMPAYFSG
jgi:hypothetical protein